MAILASTTLAVTALQSLAMSAFWKSASVNFTTNDAHYVSVQVALATANTGAGNPTGYCNVYMACSSTGSAFDAMISAGDATWTSTAPPTAEAAKQLMYLGRAPFGVVAGTTTTQNAVRTFWVPPGSVPGYGVVVIENQNKALLSSTNAVTVVEYKFAAP